MENPHHRTNMEILENDNTMLETVYKHNNRIKTKYVHTINKCNGKLTIKEKDCQIRLEENKLCFMQETLSKNKGAQKVENKKSKEIKSKYRH